MRGRFKLRIGDLAQCSCCKEMKSPSEFTPFPGGSLRCWCKNCYLLKQRQYRNKNASSVNKKQRKYRATRPESQRIYQRKRALKHTYKMSLENFAVMWWKQEGCCYICGSSFENKKDTHIDHCHKTGAVRRLLCNRCNSGIGWFREDTTILRTAIEYLNEANTCKK